MRTDLAKLYDEIAKDYAIADKFGSLSLARDIAIAQIKLNLLDESSTENFAMQGKEDVSVVDFGVGDGTFLHRLNPVISPHFCNINFVGLDISASMLALAAEKLALQTIVGKIYEAEKLVGQNHFDLAVCQFILAYVDINLALHKAKLVLKGEGYLSLVTTTSEGMSVCRAHVLNRIGRGGISGFVIRKILENTLRTLLIPSSYKDIENAAIGAGFSIVANSRINIPVHFENLDDFMEISFKGGWMANLIDNKYIPTRIGLYLARKFFASTLKFPIDDTHVIEIVLLRNKSTPLTLV